MKLAAAKRPHEQRELVREMKREARVYELLAERGCCGTVAPAFLGVAEVGGGGAMCLCVAAESASFEDIGLENLPRALRLSAIAALEELHATAEVVHGDLSLGNFVRSARDPLSARLIDFGRSLDCKALSADKGRRARAEELQFARQLLQVPL